VSIPDRVTVIAMGCTKFGEHDEPTLAGQEWATIF